MKVTTASQMAEIDRKTIQDLGVLGAILMENAARSVCRVFDQMAEEGSKVLALCGSGNNGGDGFCVVRILHNWGYDVKVAHVGRVQTLKEDARLNYELAKKWGIEIISIKEEEDIPKLREAIEDTHWLVDALLGTGLSRPVRGIVKKALEVASKSGKRCIAIDIPSGIDASSGKVLGPVIKCDATVTFGLPKIGHFVYPGASYIGKLTVADIGFPPHLLEDENIKVEVISPQKVKKFLDPKPLDSHKGTWGKLAVLGGSRSLLGAPVISARAALRMGTGYVRVFVPHLLEPTVKAMAPELVSVGLPDREGGYFCADSLDMFLGISRGSTAVAFGPGLDSKAFTHGFVIDVLEEVKVPMVIDADALNFMAKEEHIERDPNVPWVLTPHPGEAARLLGTSVSEILDSPIESLKKLVEKYQAVVVLKGANPLIMNTDGTLVINPAGNPVLSVIGSGDILTGIIGSLLARGIPAFESAWVGSFIHGVMGDLVSEVLSKEGILPPEMLPFIPEAINLIRDNSIKEYFSYIR